MMAPLSKTEAERDEARSGDVIVDAEASSSSSATARPPPAAAASAAAPSTSASAPSTPPPDEVERILRVQHNAYAVLKLDRRAKV